MPGCVELGVRLFAECCALEQVGAITDGACHLAIGAVIGPYGCEECARLSQLSLPHVRAMMDGVVPSTPQTGIPQGCFHSSGIQQVVLGGDACFIGHRAYENCKLLIIAWTQSNCRPACARFEQRYL